jgi:hypothetical protein
MIPCRHPGRQGSLHHKTARARIRHTDRAQGQ